LTGRSTSNRRVLLATRREGSVHSRIPILLRFYVQLPGNGMKGRWRERGRIGREGRKDSE
jgi:hypothetical protein